VREFLREFFDRAGYDCRRGRVIPNKNSVESFLADVPGGLPSERVFPRLSQRLAPIFKDLPERAFARAVAGEAFLVFQLDIEAVDFDRGKREAL
jgi:hypothetical protein